MPRHVVTFTYGWWGHLRPQISFVSRLIMAEPDILVTMIFDAKLTKVRAQLDYDMAGKSAENVKYCTLADGAMFDGESIEAEFAKVYANILETAKIQPDVFLGEMGTYDTGSIVRKLSKDKTPKIVFWYPGPLSALYAYAHRWHDDIDRLMDIDYMTVATTFDQNRDIAITGLPTISGNELFAQPVNQVPLFPVDIFAEKSTQMWLVSDAMLGGTSGVLEPQQAAQLRSAMKMRGRDLFLVGDNNRPVDLAAVNVDPVVTAFLDGKAQKSVLYIAFGSTITYNTPDKFHAFMDVVLELGIPFILAHGDNAALLPERFANSELGLVLKWAPQQHILSHASTGWFLSHAGFTSTKESLSAGVPMVCWPLLHDQPLVAIIVDQVLGAGYELQEVRGGRRGLQPRKSNGKTPVGTLDAVRKEANEVLFKAFFDEAERAKKYEAVDKVCKALNAAWDPDGVSTSEMKRFLEFI